MKKEFTAGMYCKFPNEQIPRILDILCANDHRMNFGHAAESNDCVLVDPSGRLSPFTSSLMTDAYLPYKEIDIHSFMIIALRLEEGMGIHWEQSSIGQRQHIAVEMENLGIKQTVPTQERGETRYGGSFMLSSGEWKMTTASVKHQIPYTDWCARLCVEPVDGLKGEKPPYKEGDKVRFLIDGKEGAVKSCYNAVGGWRILASVIGDNDRDFLANRVEPIGNNTEKLAEAYENIKVKMESAQEKESVFDPGKPFEVFWNGKWQEPYLFSYIGQDSLGKHVIERLENNVVMCFTDDKVRNTPEFNASMLNVGEWMEREPNESGTRSLLLRISFGLIDVNNPDGLFHEDALQYVKGRRVDVEIKIVG